MLKELARGEAPLALPIDILKLLTLEYGAGRDRPDSVNLNYGMLVDEYFTLDGEKKQELQDLRQKWEALFQVFARVRSTFDEMFKDGKVERPSSFGVLIREHYKEEAFLFSMMEDFYTITGEKLPANQLNDFFAAST